MPSRRPPLAPRGRRREAGARRGGVAAHAPGPWAPRPPQPAPLARRARPRAAAEARGLALRCGRSDGRGRRAAGCCRSLAFAQTPPPPPPPPISFSQWNLRAARGEPGGLGRGARGGGRAGGRAGRRAGAESACDGRRASGPTSSVLAPPLGLRSRPSLHRAGLAPPSPLRPAPSAAATPPS